MTKTQLRETIGFSTVTLAKISKHEYISLRVIDEICQYFECKIEDVVEVKPTIKVKINDYNKS